MSMGLDEESRGILASYHLVPVTRQNLLGNFAIKHSRVITPQFANQTSLERYLGLILSGHVIPKGFANEWLELLIHPNLRQNVEQELDKFEVFKQQLAAAALVTTDWLRGLDLSRIKSFISDGGIINSLGQLCESRPDIAFLSPSPSFPISQGIQRQEKPRGQRLTFFDCKEGWAGEALFPSLPEQALRQKAMTAYFGFVQHTIAETPIPEALETDITITISPRTIGTLLLAEYKSA